MLLLGVLRLLLLLLPQHVSILDLVLLLLCMLWLCMMSLLWGLRLLWWLLSWRLLLLLPCRPRSIRLPALVAAAIVGIGLALLLLPHDRCLQMVGGWTMVFWLVAERAQADERICRRGIACARVSFKRAARALLVDVFVRDVFSLARSRLVEGGGWAD